MGMRISEINGLKYSNIDFINRRLHVEEQLGRDLKKDKTECQKKTLTKQRVKLKTKNSQRWLDIPDLLFEAILEQRVIYEKNRKRRINDKTCPFTDEIIYDCLDVLEPFIESVIPKKDTGNHIFDYTNLEADKYFDKFYNSLCIV